MAIEIRTLIAYLGVRYDWNKEAPGSFGFILSGYRLHVYILHVSVCIQSNFIELYTSSIVYFTGCKFNFRNRKVYNLILWEKIFRLHKSRGNLLSMQVIVFLLWSSLTYEYFIIYICETSLKTIFCSVATFLKVIQSHQSTLIDSIVNISF